MSAQCPTRIMMNTINSSHEGCHPREGDSQIGFSHSGMFEVNFGSVLDKKEDFHYWSVDT